MPEKIPRPTWVVDSSELNWITFVEDGDWWAIHQDKDYVSQRGVLTSMSRFAKKRGYVLDRVVHADKVEFRFSVAPAAL